MSLRKRNPGWRPRAGRLLAPVIVLMAGALALAGCADVRPLYDGGGGTTAFGPAQGPVAAELSRIAVEPQSDRVGQKLRNELLFRLGGGATPSGTSDDAYTLTLRVRSVSRNVLVRPEVSRSTGRHVTLTVSYNLLRTGEEDPLTSGTVQRIATIEVSDQLFAAERAELDAEDRAAVEAADSIRTDLAAWFAANN